MGLMRAIVVILFSSLFFYVAHQLTRFAELSFAMTALVLLGLGLIFATVISMPLYFWAENRLNHKSWHDAFFAAAHLALGYLNFILVFVIIRDVVSFAAHFAQPDWDAGIMYRAEGLQVMLILPALFLLAGTLVVRTGPHLHKVKLHFPNLPAGLEGLRLLHISDLHICRGLPVSFVEKLVRLANKANADVVMYTGDIVDAVVTRHLREVEMISKIQSKYGQFYVPGNHEYYWQINDTLKYFEKWNFHILINKVESLTIQGSTLQVSGVSDPAARMAQMEMPDFKKVGALYKPEAFKILLSHQPSLAPHAAEIGADLQLSGHTHAGQFFPWNLLIGFFQKYPKGLYHIEKLQLYVNQGTGYWGPSLRLGTYCELTEITLTAAKK